MSKLTKPKGQKIQGERLTSAERLNRPFIISFRQKLHRGYRLTDLEIDDLKDMQSFFDIASQLSINEMDKQYRRISDKNDKVNGQQVQHYGHGDRFRIHGIYTSDNHFEVIRIDPNHKKHK